MKNACRDVGEFLSGRATGGTSRFQKYASKFLGLRKRFRLLRRRSIRDTAIAGIPVHKYFQARWTRWVRGLL